MDYRKVSEQISNNNIKVNHTTTRNYLLKAMKKIAIALCSYYGVSSDRQNIKRICESPDFQKSIGEIMIETHIKKKDQENR